MISIGYKHLLAAGLLTVVGVVEPRVAVPAPWLAPAAQEKLSAAWVKDVAREFRKEGIREVFMNAPFGSPQSSILGLLNDAAEAMNDNEIGYARDLVRHALQILDGGVEHGWYSRSEIRPIKRMIIKKANQGIRSTQEASAEDELSMPRRQSRNQPDMNARLQGSDEERLFDGPDDYALYGGEGDRWTGYTHGRRFGLTERLDESHPADRFKDEQAYRSGHRSSDRGARDQAKQAERQGQRQAQKEAALFREDTRTADEWFGLGPQERDRESRTSQRMDAKDRGGRYQDYDDNSRFRDGERRRSDR